MRSQIPRSQRKPAASGVRMWRTPGSRVANTATSSPRVDPIRKYTRNLVLVKVPSGEPCCFKNVEIDRGAPAQTGVEGAAPQGAIRQGEGVEKGASRIRRGVPLSATHDRGEIEVVTWANRDAASLERAAKEHAERRDS